MELLKSAIWWLAIALEVAMLARAWRTQLYRIFPAFFAYIFFVLLQSFVRRSVLSYDSVYAYVYWITEFIGVAFGCVIVYEIYRIGLAAYPGTAKMAKRVLSLLFAMALAKAIADSSSDPRYWAEATTIDIERALRTVQALAIAALMGLFLIYKIPFGRNLKGIALGYALFIGVSVIWITFLPAKGYQYPHLWSVLGPVTYDLALSIWVVYLWAPQYQTADSVNMRLEEQYQHLAARTRRRLKQARGFLGRVIDP
jgi:hypothetical protein